MDAKTLLALRGSIRKWQAIVAGTGVDKGTLNCPLCLMFNNETTHIDEVCVGCPVSDATGMPECENTPYNHWSARKGGAQAELDFLISLLPEGEAP